MPTNWFGPGDSTFLPKCGRQRPRIGWRWRSGEVRVTLLDEALAVAHRPDIDLFVGDGHYACEAMVTGLEIRGMYVVSKLRRDTALWVSWAEPPTDRPGRPHKYASCFDRACIGELPAVVLPDEGPRLHHAQLYYKPFQKRPRVVFFLDADADPAEETRPTTLFSTDPDMAPERIDRIYRDRFQIEFNFRAAKQHLGLAACQARTAARPHFHVNAVLAALQRKPRPPKLDGVACSTPPPCLESDFAFAQICDQPDSWSVTKWFGR